MQWSGKATKLERSENKIFNLKEFAGLDQVKTFCILDQDISIVRHFSGEISLQQRQSLSTEHNVIKDSSDITVVVILN